ncbi:Uncharacterised protein [Mycobacteroides abscessus subsp. massiliense]|nr:Uncharacterised protein [Mycobacteroides abscessus]CPW38292.1 Uncharacterised protein [Mycobacteroides abscessus]CPX18470.1 Uncharacterised protein [Mycobacteroides abscessus]CPX99427.1 Uncharacterised protein [Mycobacteroides abscessus]SKM95781.1 Uncharacterised protein [Mycobacteroides abscessus subsp. massiliense]
MTVRPHSRMWQSGVQRLQQLCHVAVTEGHTFGHTGGARGIDQIRCVVRFRIRYRAAESDIRRMRPGTADIDDRQPSPVQTIREISGGDGGDRAGVGEHESQPRIWHGGIDRQVCRTGFEDRQDRGNRLGRSVAQQRDHLPWTGAPTNQQVRQPVRCGVELPIGPGTFPAGDRHRFGGTAHLLCKKSGDRSRPRRRPGQGRVVAQDGQAAPLIVVEQIHNGQPRRRIRGHCRQHPLQPSHK